jgi:hypothetical protein
MKVAIGKTSWGRVLFVLGGMLLAGAGFAQIPRVFLDTTYSPPPDFSGREIGVPAGGDLRSALEGARAGDTIEAGGAWIRIRSLSPGSTGSDRRVYTAAPSAPVIASAADVAQAAAPSSDYSGLLGLHSRGPAASVVESVAAMDRGPDWKPAKAGRGWPMRGSDPANTSHAAALGPVVQVQPAWTFQPDASTRVWRPAVAPDGTIYVTTVSFPAGGVDGRLYALRPDGSVKWQTPLTNSSGLNVWASATPVVDGDGNIYVAWAHDSDFGSLTAISLDPSGAVRWRFEPKLELEFALNQQPVLGHGVLYAAADTSFFFGDPAQRASLFALDLATGIPAWRWTSPNLDTFFDGPAVGNDGYLYHASAANPARGASGFLYRIRPDGTLDWSADIGVGVNQAPPAIDAQNNLYLADAAGIASKYDSSGARLWTYDTMAFQIYYPPMLNGARVTVGAAFAGLHVLDADTGKREALFAPGCYPFSQASDRAGNTFFYCFDAAGTVFGFGRGGRQWWSFATGRGTTVNGMAIAANGSLLVGNSGTLTAYIAPVLGDLNCDGGVDELDIGPYFLAFTDPVGYAQRYPQCTRSLADINGDGAIDAFDLAPFFRLLED